MDCNAYNRKVASHLFDLFVESDMDRWHMYVDLNQIEHAGLRQMNVPVLNFYPTAVRDVQIGADCITFNMALSGKRTHVVVPFTAVMGIALRLDEGELFVSANMAMKVQEPTAANEAETTTEEKKTTVVTKEGNVAYASFGQPKTTN